MPRLFIAADIEGCAAVASQQALSSTEWEWQAAREWMTNEVVAACEAALEHGIDEIIVADGHGNAQNVLPDKLPEGTRLVRSWPRPLLQMQGIESGDIVGAFFVGFHNGSQGDGGILSHTYHGGAIRDLRLNGVSASEGYFNAALAGEFDVPVLLVTGDATAAEDAARYSPNAETCIVKEAIGFRSQAAIPPKSACRLIRESARAALQKLESVKPFRVGGPVEIEIEMTNRLAPEMLDYLPIVEQIGPYAIRAEFTDMIAAMRFVSFVILFDATGRIHL